MCSLHTIAALALLLAAQAVHADPCKVTIEGNDNMQFSLRQIAVPATCAEIEVTLKHSGKMTAKIMGHDWVLAKDSDVSAIVNGGLSSGFSQGFLPENDKRVVAATRVIGGGESATIRFSTSTPQPGSRYIFFCSSPGHSTVMRGTFLVGEANQIAKAP